MEELKKIIEQWIKHTLDTQDIAVHNRILIVMLSIGFLILSLRR